MAGGQRRSHHVEELAYLPVDDDGVEPLLTAEVLIDDWLGNLRAGGDLLDRRAFEAALGEQCPGDLDELLPPLRTRHARAGVALVLAHCTIVSVRRPGR